VLKGLSRFVTSHPRWIAIVALLVAIGAAIYGSGVAHELAPGGFEVAGGEASRVATTLSERFEDGEPDVIALVDPVDPGLDARDPGVRQSVEALAARLHEHAAVRTVVGPTTGGDDFVSEDGRTAMLAIALHGSALEKEEAYPEIAALLHDAGSDLDVNVGGQVAVNSVAQTLAEADLLRAELVAFPIVAVLLLVFFGGRILAAVLPLVVGGISIALATAILRALTLVTDVSVFALNVVTLLGLGLAIDYSLFIVQRFREELAVTGTARAAARTITSAGKTMLYSGLAVAVSVSGLLVFPIALLHSIAIGGALVVGLTMLASIVVLPAMLALLGPRVEWPRGPRPRVDESRHGWARVARRVMQRPGLVAVATATLLVVMGAPFLRLEPQLSDARIFPPDSEVRIVQHRLDAAEGFGQEHEDRYDLVLVAERPVLEPATMAELQALHEALRGEHDVIDVQGLGMMDQGGATPPPPPEVLASVVDGDATRMTVVMTAPATAKAREEQVARIRRIASRDFTVAIGGRPKVSLEVGHALAAGMIPAVSIVVGATLVVLTLAFGAIVVAAKAVVMNALSLAASFGALVWIFQDGRFEGLLHYRTVDGIDPLVPLIMFAIVFGLSMDYELFLLSRIRESYDATGDSDRAVASGLAKTGRIITMAGAMLIVVLLGFASARILIVKQLGLGMAIAILVDATIVRALLVPATMRLLGRYNWASPPWFSRWWTRTGIGVQERDPTPDPSPP
jgi:uncharacterized membrane protein YdfJ with MMPL/SSD domain